MTQTFGQSGWAESNRVESTTHSLPDPNNDHSRVYPIPHIRSGLHVFESGQTFKFELCHPGLLPRNMWFNTLFHADRYYNTTGSTSPQNPKPTVF